MASGWNIDCREATLKSLAVALPSDNRNEGWTEVEGFRRNLEVLISRTQWLVGWERKGKREKSQVLAWTAALVLFIKAQEWSS